MKETYVSIDIETDGPAPGLNSMIALGAAAFLPEEDKIELWYSTLEPLPEAHTDIETMKWWDTQPEAYIEVTSNPKDAALAIVDFADWVDSLPGKKIAVGWPIAFDFAFVNYYCHRFAGRNPLGHGGLDIRSYANGLAGSDSYLELTQEYIETVAGEINKAGMMQHVAIHDAIYQGRLFMALRKLANASPRP